MPSAQPTKQPSNNPIVKETDELTNQYNKGQFGFDVSNPDKNELAVLSEALNKNAGKSQDQIDQEKLFERTQAVEEKKKLRAFIAGEPYLSPEEQARRGDVVMRPLTSLWKTVQSGIVDQLPKEYAVQRLRMSKGNFGDLFDKRSDLNAFGDKIPKEISRHDYSVWNNKQPASVRNLSDDEKAKKFIIEKYGEDTYKKMVANFKIENQEQRQGFEKEVAQQGLEAIDKLKGVTQNLKDIEGAADFLSFTGNMVGQALYRAPTSILSGGTGSIVAESAAIYDRQIDLIAQKNGITRAEVIKQGLDKPASGQALATMLGGLDAMSAGTVVGLFKKAITKELTENAAKEFAKQFVRAATPEAITEGIQGEGEEYGAAKGAEVDYKFDPWRLTTSVAGGFIGGGVLGSVDMPSVTPKAESFTTAAVKETAPVENLPPEKVELPAEKVAPKVPEISEKPVKVSKEPTVVSEPDKEEEPEFTPPKGFENIITKMDDDVVDVSTVQRTGIEPEGYQVIRAKRKKGKGGDLFRIVPLKGEKEISRNWLTEQGLAYELQSMEEEKASFKDKKGKEYKILGKNTDGETVGEDSNGVRAILNKGVIRNQPVSVVPKKEGVEIQSNPPEGEFLTTDEIKVEEDKPVADNKEAFVTDLTSKLGEVTTKTQLEKVAKEHGITDKNEVKELAELAVVQKAREISRGEGTFDQKYKSLVDLYESQPNMTHRTSESIGKQQYSTPVPIGFLSGQYANLDQVADSFEPSAGNGMLTISADPGSVTVNEIDKVRLNNLSKQGFKEILDRDGSQEFDREKTYDAVVTNPPFGGTKEVNIGGYKFNELAQIMSVRALNTMKDGGKASIIIGGNNKFDDKGRLVGRDRIYFNYLFNNYNVEDVIDVDGDLYRKQGAGFPIRMVLINGRKSTPEGAAPTREWFKDKVTNFDQLKERVAAKITDPNVETDESLQSKQLGPGKTTTVDRGSSRVGKSKTEKSGTLDVPAEEVSGAGGKVTEPGTKDQPVSERPVTDTGTEQRSGVDNRSDTGESTISRGTERQGLNESGEQQQSTGTEQSTAAERPRTARKVVTGEVSGNTVDYKPLSQAKSFELKSPAGMRQEVSDALTDLENEVGNVDDFVMDRLAYRSKEELYEALGAEQIDGVALAIRNIERGTALIIGDQTGIGKGRQAAAIIRYANMQDLPPPIFMTEKPGLFSDLWRDLRGIKYGHIKPFIVNSATSGKFDSISDGETGEVYHKPYSSTNKVYQRIIDTGALPDDIGVVLTTYSQFANPVLGKAKNRNKKIDFLKAVTPGTIVIMDESHNASGAGNTSAVIQDILQQAKGAVYLSGTFAKRADNMPVYAIKTSMNEANMSHDQLVEAVEKGGIALQEIIASNLASSGEMVRRQRTFDGIDVENYVLGGEDAALQKQHLEKADRVTDIIRKIIDFQRTHVKPFVNGMDQDAAKAGEAVTLRGGTNQAGVDNYPYFSKVFNVINQLLYSIKAKDTARLAIEEHKAGRKPFIAIRSTLESMLKDLRDEGMMEMGDVIDADFSYILQKGLDGVMRITVKDPGGTRHKEVINPGDLPADGEMAYHALKEEIQQSATGLNISPIDELVEELEKAGLKVAEVTGRQMKLKLRPDGKAEVNAKKREPTNVAYRKFNSGEYDVIIVNSSGSTGASAHSDKSFKDQRQRTMLVLEPELNISTLVQLLGRVNRTGQVNKPKYKFVNSVIPAENRLTMMTMRKLKSLDANTTSNQKQSKSILEVPEIFNKYGDQVVIEYLQENPELIEMLDDPLKMLNTGDLKPINGENAATRVSGRVAVLSSKQQKDFYDEIIERYNKMLNFLNEAGMNDLQVSYLPLNAKSKSKNVKIVGKGGVSKFGDDTYLETMEVDVLKKPMTRAEMDEVIKDLNKEKIDHDTEIEKYRAATIEAVTAEEGERIQKQIQKVKEHKKLSDEEKAERVEQLEKNAGDTLERKIANEESNIKYIQSLFNFFTPGRAIKVPLQLDDVGMMTNMALSDGVFLGFDINLAKKKPYLRSNIVLKIAVHDGRRLLSIPASKASIVNNIRANSYSLSDSHQESIDTGWDKLKKPAARTNRFIVTGNIMQGLGDSAFQSGTIIEFSTADGFVDKGILLPESFDPKEEGVNKTVSVPAKKAAPVLLNSEIGTVMESSDKIWKIEKKGTKKYSIRLPKSKQIGGKYYLDSQITDLVDGNRFDSVGGEMEAFTDSSRLDELMTLLANKHSTSFDIDSKALNSSTVDMSKRSGSMWEEQNIQMASLIPGMKPGKVRKRPQNPESALEAYQKDIAFKNKEAEQRYKEAQAFNKPKSPNKIVEKIKEVLGGFRSHFEALPEKQFPRESNILRAFETIGNSVSAKARTYVKGLLEPLTPEQYQILNRRLLLEDMLHSVEIGENMTDLDGKLPFGFEDEGQVRKELNKFIEMTEKDPNIQRAYDLRQNQMKLLENSLVANNIISEQDRPTYYHRRVLAYMSEEKTEATSKGLKPKKHSWQMMRTGTRGMDYSTNFIENEMKVYSEALYELEKARHLKELMEPYESVLRGIKNEFNRLFDDQVNKVEAQFGKKSDEVAAFRESKRGRFKEYLEQNKPDGYLFWQAAPGNSLFWRSSVTEQKVDGAISEAKVKEATGIGSSMDVLEALVNEIDSNLVVGPRRKEYLVPAELGRQLTIMGQPTGSAPIAELSKFVTNAWKALMLFSPNRVIKYNLNNLMGDTDGMIAADPVIMKFIPQAVRELKNFTKTGELTPGLIEAMEQSVTDSGFDMSEFRNLTDQQWVQFLTGKETPTIENVFDMKRVAEQLKRSAVKKPQEIFRKYWDFVTTFSRVRENVYRYAAYLRASERTAKGEKFYWASNPKKVEALRYDPKRMNGLLAREVLGDYGNISYSGQQLRNHLLPFYSWMEINLKRYVRLFRNAGSRKAQSQILAAAGLKGAIYVGARMAYSYGLIGLFTAMVEAYNYLRFPDEAEKLRRAGTRGMQVIVSVDPKTGTTVNLPVIGAFYDFTDYFGIPDLMDEYATIMMGHGNEETYKEIFKTMMVEAPSEKVFQQLSPMFKTPIELISGQQYFPDAQNPRPINDYGEYIANVFTVKDEYKAITGKPMRQDYFWGHFSKMMFNEISPQELSYYQASRMVQDYTGTKISVNPTNPREKAKKEALHNFSMAMRYDQPEKATQYLQQYVLSGGTREGLRRSFQVKNPMNGLKQVEKADLLMAINDENYKPKTYFVQRLNKSELLVFKDAIEYYFTLVGGKGKTDEE